MQDSSPESVFAARLRQAREAAGMTQPELADRLREQSGIRLDATAITRMERGQRMIRLNEAIHLSALLDVRLMDLVLLPPWAAGLSPRDQSAQMRAISAEIARLDAAAAQAQADATESEIRAAELRERREDLAVKLAIMNASPREDGD